MQPWNNRRNSAIHNARAVLEQLNTRIVLPELVAAAVHRLDRITNSAPKQPAADAIRAAIFDGADQDNINALLLQDLGYARLAAEHQQARVDAALAVLQTIHDAHDDIYPQLKALADKQIEHLHTVAQLDTRDIMALVRTGEHKAAQAVAETNSIAAELDALYQLRDGYLVPGGLETMRPGHGVDATRWRDGNPHKAGKGDTPATRYLDGLVRCGNTLWYPTQAEAIDAARPAWLKLQGQHQEAERIRREQNRAAAAFAG